MIGFLKRVFAPRNLLHILCFLGSLALLLSYLNPLIHPKTFGLLSFLGLAYPLVVAFNLIMLIIALLARSKWWLIISALLILGIRFHLRVFAIGSDNEVNGDKNVKVLSYNVHLLGRYLKDPESGIRNRDAIFSYLKQEAPDIVCFQEFYHQDPPTDFVTQDSLIPMLGMLDKHERYRYYMYSRQNFGVCMLSKYPMIRKGNVKFENAENSSNFCIYADMVIKGDTIRVYNVHLQSIKLEDRDFASFKDTNSNLSSQSDGMFRILRKVNDAFPVRAEQADLITGHIKKSPYPVIVCGDFNDTPVSYSYHQFSAILTDAFRNCSSGMGITYAGKIPAGRIDYIFHSRSLGSTNFTIQNEELSDHYGISCVINLSNTSKK